MENKRQVSGSSSSSSSSSSSVSLDHLFGPKDSSSSSSSTSGIFDTIFPPPSTVLGRDSSHSGMMGSWNNQGLPHHGKYGNPDHTTDSKGQSSGTTNKDKSSSVYHNETVEPCNLSSSIYYGGQENYSPRKKTTESPHYFKKDGGDDDPNGNNSGGASRGNWWQGSLYY
ncbi:suppressor protein SRP40-like isoform X2 [Durio zibethinus]|uniref:Suppressor protein SRP40-like isoform X2 n=1 Tax=Durio zibethinus TaxID=66656 RepID=A0A6P5YY15_DURZI|nr:suppressor protein SRP40-like isoform X2 [Durio zibethinus]